jgi:hypothetical protein
LLFKPKYAREFKYWTTQLCQIEHLIDRLEGTVPPNLNEIFFGPPASATRVSPTPMFGTGHHPAGKVVRRKIRWSRTSKHQSPKFSWQKFVL